MLFLSLDSRTIAVLGRTSVCLRGKFLIPEHWKFNQVFQSYKDLEKHIISEACLAQRKQQESICQYMTCKYVNMFTAAKTEGDFSKKERRSLVTNFDQLYHEVLGEHLPRDEGFEHLQEFQMGFALKVRKKPTKYNQNQKEYLRKIFLDGEKAGKKFQPEEISELMKHATKDGQPGQLRFSVSEWLTEAQIRYQLAKMTVQLKNTGKIDLQEMVERSELHEAVEANDAQMERQQADNLHSEINNLEMDVDENRPQCHPWIVSKFHAI